MTTKKVTVLLKLPFGEDELYFVINTEHTQDKNFNPEYFYEEHTCPTNFLQNCVEVILKKKDGTVGVDPHGLFKYIGTVDGIDDDEFFEGVLHIPDGLKKYFPEAI